MANKISPLKICPSTAQTKNDSSLILIEENIFLHRIKNFFSEELQGAFDSDEIDQLASHRSACLPQDISINHQHPKS